MRKNILSMLIIALCFQACGNKDEKTRTAISDFLKSKITSPKNFKLISFNRNENDGVFWTYDCSYVGENSHKQLVNRSCILKVDSTNYMVKQNGEESLDLEPGHISGSITLEGIFTKKMNINNIFLRLINIDTLNKSYVFEYRTGTSSHYSFKDIPPGNYFIVAQSENIEYKDIPVPEVFNSTDDNANMTKNAQLYNNLTPVLVYSGYLAKSYNVKNSTYLHGLALELKNHSSNNDFYRTIVSELPDNLESDFFLQPDLEKIVKVEYITISPNRETLHDLNFFFL